MPNGISDPEPIKTVVHEFSLWIPLISALVGASVAGLVALAVSVMNHRFARDREDRASEKRKLHEQQLMEEAENKELRYIATELIFILEMFVEGCARVASDKGEEDEQGEFYPSEKQPELSLAAISGNWRMIPPLIMYRINELPLLQNEARRDISAASEHSWAPFHTEAFQERQYQYARLGLKALILSKRLRKKAGFPENRLNATEWSAQPVLWAVWRKERERRTRLNVQRQQAYSARAGGRICGNI